MRTLLLLVLVSLLSPAAYAARVNIPQKDLDMVAKLPVRTGGFGANRGPYKMWFKNPSAKGAPAAVTMSRTWRAGKGGNVEFTWTLSRDVNGKETRTLTAQGIKKSAAKP